jgi:uncharacterized protein with PIN domain
VKVERVGDLMFVTYYMVDWTQEKETPSGKRCAECGGEMGELEATTRDGRSAYAGLVCHKCKRLLWLRNG